MRRGVGDVGDVPGAAGHPGDQVGVDGADRRTGPDSTSAQVCGSFSAQPHQLGAGEVRVEPQPGQLGDPVLVALVAQARADVGGTPVLPDDRAPRRAEGLAVPQQDRLALVGDADRPAARAASYLLSGAAGGLEGRLPDLLGRVLDPARLREVLGELLVARAAIRPSAVTTTAVTPVVPASMARTLMPVRRPRRGRCRGSAGRSRRGRRADPHLVVLGADPGGEVGVARGARELLELARAARRSPAPSRPRSRRSGRGR